MSSSERLVSFVALECMIVFFNFLFFSLLVVRAGGRMRHHLYLCCWKLRRSVARWLCLRPGMARENGRGTWNSYQLLSTPTVGKSRLLARKDRTLAAAGGISSRWRLSCDPPHVRDRRCFPGVSCPRPALSLCSRRMTAVMEGRSSAFNSSMYSEQPTPSAQNTPQVSPHTPVHKEREREKVIKRGPPRTDAFVELW